MTTSRNGVSRDHPDAGQEGALPGFHGLDDGVGEDRSGDESAAQGNYTGERPHDPQRAHIHSSILPVRAGV